MRRRWPAAVMGLASAVLLQAGDKAGVPLTADQIMRKVAWNQGRAQEMRTAFRYQQSLLIRFHRGGDKLCREEQSEFDVQPTHRGSKKTRTHFSGRYRDGKELYDYYEPGYTYKDLDIDGEIISDIADDLTNDDRSRDGISRDLFPLTMSKIKRYEFQLQGTEQYRGHEVYRITFRPLNNSWANDGPPWAGEALIDTEKFQPLVVTTELARGLPVVVRTLLGTNLKHLGFKVTYEEFEDDLWFPVSYGGEFIVRAVFFYKRKISISLRNSGFERAEVTSSVAYGEPLQ